MKSNKALKRKVRNSYLISTISISLVLFLLGSVGYLLLTAHDLSQSLRESITATVELKSGINEENTETIRRAIAAYPIASEVRFSSKNEKIHNTEFREMFGLEFENILSENPLMDSFEVVLSAEASDITKLEEFSNSLKRVAGVDRVTYPALLVEEVHSTVGKFQLVIMIFGSALLFISLILLNNTIRMAIFSKRGLINTMKLVGATKGFIMRPFLWSGLWSGFCAGIMASIILAASLVALSETLPSLLRHEEMMRVLHIMGAMILGGVIISMFFTWIAVNRFVNMKRNNVHLY
ncbi:MAG: permease-like cell division protein FtsX [Rikenellaceae bacterium]